MAATDPTVRLAEPVKEAMKEVVKPKPAPLDTQASIASGTGTYKTTGSFSSRHEKEKKLGHRRVHGDGQVTYKKKPTTELMAAIQLGIGQSITMLAVKPKRDVLINDFYDVESVSHPREGSNLTPAHHYSDFRFKTYAPTAFRHFRELFNIQPDDFLLSMCNEPLKELSNPGASGSIFYITCDDEFIIKTVQSKEAAFLQGLLPGYYMNLNQNPRTLLPKFYGLYCYQSTGKNIRFVAMNNLLPSSIQIHEKYDLKGSTYKRKASKKERAKKSPTLKDLDYRERHPDGIMLEAETYNALKKTIERDCRVLQSFQIMDYSMLLGIHNLDQSARDREQEEEGAGAPSSDDHASSKLRSQNSTEDKTNSEEFSRVRSVRQRLANYSTAMEAIQARVAPIELENEDIPAGGIPARNSKGERLILYLGIIDILQNYRLGKRAEHFFKGLVADADTVSVHRPDFYAQRFQDFLALKVFKKIPSSLKQSPSKKKTGMVRTRVPAEGEDAGAIGGRPDLLPTTSTPPPTFAEAIGQDGRPTSYIKHTSPTKSSTSSHHYQRRGGPLTPDMGLLGSPAHSAHSVAESTPTHTEHTEGTPSFTASSPSCSSEMLDTPQSGIRASANSHRSADVSVEQITVEMGSDGEGRIVSSEVTSSVNGIANTEDEDEHKANQDETTRL